MALIPSLLIIIVFGVGIFINRRQLFEIGRVLKSQKIFTPQVALPSRTRLPLAPTTNDDRLNVESLKEAIGNLIDFAKSKKPRWILGVHPGGRLLSVYVANEIQVPPERCLHVRTNQNRYVQFVPQINQALEGSLLLIDDISRTGRTLGRIKAELIAKNYTDNFYLGRVQIAVLVVESNESFRPDFASFRTDVDYLRFPWSQYSADVGLALTLKNDNLSYDRRVMNDYEHLSSDFGYALRVAKSYLR
jgi:hypoxanthine phosphoribosyltransferase